ncbi:YkgB family protein [Novosphingopyxis sp.]|uniref:YkgB family protein n=1 Tax=Novosphingopyxis sp. TaxID=2709690 RepID=UPI003B5C2F47
MARTETTVRDERFYDRYTTPSAGALLVTYALALIFLWFGFLKFTQYEAAGIAPLVMNSPLVGWWHGLFGIPGTARMLGVYEILTGLLLAARPFNARIASIGGAMATICFLITITFMFTTPGVVQPGFDNPLAISAFPGQFLLKDVVLLAVSIWILFAARSEASIAKT